MHRKHKDWSEVGTWSVCAFMVAYMAAQVIRAFIK